MLTANFKTVASQTSKRVSQSGLCALEEDANLAASQRVLRYSDAQQISNDFKKFKRRVKNSPSTLYVVIADEAHWGSLKGKAHDAMINDYLLTSSENVVILSVSATLYCLLTLDSRIPQRYQSPDRAISMLVHTCSDGSEQVFDESNDPGYTKPLSSPPDLAKVPEVNMLSWREVVRGEGSLVSKEDANWLREKLQMADSWRDDVMSSDSSTYRSLAWYLGPDGTENGQRLLRDDAGDSNASRSLPFENLVLSAPGSKPADLLAVDYAIQCIFLCDSAKFAEHAAWLIDSAPYGFKPAVHAYLQAHGQPPNTQGLLFLLNNWIHPQSGVQHVSETCRCVWELLSKEQTRMQVVRITDAPAGGRMLKLLRAMVQRQPSLAQSFELLGDFGDLDIEAEMDQDWFDEFQRTTMQCPHRIGALRTPCPCKCYVPPTKRFTTKKERYKNRRCAECGHVHVPVQSYADLENRPVLLILVAKGRLGDTFPQTLRCIDMRSRCRADEPRMMMSTLVQELGRLCGYPSGEDTELPYALVSTMLKQDMKVEEEGEVCLSCGIGSWRDGNEILLCEGCDTPYHLHCLRPPLASVPQGDWFCPTCQPSSSVSSSRPAPPAVAQLPGGYRQVVLRLGGERWRAGDDDSNDDGGATGGGGASGSTAPSLMEGVLEERSKALNGSPEGRLAQLLASHGARLDGHMQLEHKQLWDQESAGCDSLLSVTRLMRRCCRARSSAAGGQTDKSEGAGPSYDADRRSENLAIDDRYHSRRIGLSAEPQVQIASKNRSFPPS